MKRFNLGFMVGFFIVAFSGTLVFLLTSSVNKMINEKRKHDRMEFVKDSFQVEYYKKQIDSFYIFEHSKIQEAE